MKNIEFIKYTWEHKKAFLKVEKLVRGHITLRGLLHDLDKLILYPFLDQVTVNTMHRKYMGHHLRTFKNHTIKDYEEAIIDWECARYTKPDKPLNARETMKKFYSEFEKELIPILDKFGL